MSEINRAIEILKSGGVVGMPTETVYGLAGSIKSSVGIETIFKTKERPFFDPLIVHVASFEQAQSCIQNPPEYFEKLARRVWPGPVTFILPKAEHISDMITSGLETVGVRFPAHPVAQKLIEMLGHPVAAPSANKFKKTSPTNYDHVKNEFREVFVLNGGDCEVGIESTILGLNDGLIKIYRPGMLSREDLMALLKELSISGVDVTYEESPVAPGHLKHHYMPNTKIVLYSEDKKDQIPPKLLNGPCYWKLPLNPTIAARELYGKFRELDRLQSSAILISISDMQLKDDHFKGILNRLEKAASYRFI